MCFSPLTTAPQGTFYLILQITQPRPWKLYNFPQSINVLKNQDSNQSSLTLVISALPTILLCSSSLMMVELTSVKVLDSISFISRWQILSNHELMQLWSLKGL